MAEEQLFKCHRCGKEKTKDQGYLKLGELLFCCKECCTKEEEKKDGDKAPNVCEFC
ncbi:hypothetical protein HY633_03220 [Candidatus Uhrbacteria bacterium]|nr:hypothetical protein [Candidatus Uhrbacteria bacterium]